MDISTSYSQYLSESYTKIDSKKAKNLDKKKLKEASQGLEAELFKVILKQSKKTIFNTKDKSNKAPGKDIMTDFMLEKFAEDISKKSPLGLSNMIIKDVESKENKVDEE